MKIYLAPMEGLADVHLRQLIAQTGGYDMVFTEFVRVVDQLLPEHVFLRQAPELDNQGYTRCRTPVRVQLLGNHPDALAANANRACEMGSHGIDLNFGCPSKTVNASKGGAILLKEPETIYRVVKNVREQMPTDQPLSAKMRLGFDDESTMWECAQAISEAGANEIIVHARTRSQGYKPPAYWHKAEDFEHTLQIPLTINGEIWTPDDAKRATAEANCQSLMLGRGAIRNPFLAQEIKNPERAAALWTDIAPLILEFWDSIVGSMSPRYCSGRLKQWLSYLRESYVQAEDLFSVIRKSTEVEDITILLKREIEGI